MELLWKLWDAANGIAAFSVLQSLTVVVALGSSQDFNDNMGSTLGVTLGVVVSLFAGAVHALGIWKTGRSAEALMPETASEVEHRIWKGAVLGRIVAIVLFSSIAALACGLVHLRHQSGVSGDEASVASDGGRASDGALQTP